VAYLGANASELLPLNEGDELVVDMSLRAAKSSQTDPREVRKYIDEGVSVYSCANLHAKVFVLGDTLVVGSANVSQRSRDYLAEAALITNAPVIVKSARDFVQSISLDLVTRGRLEECERVYIPPKFLGGGGSAGVATSAEIWCRKVMKELAPRAIRRSHRGRYYIELDCNSVKRIYLSPTDDFESDPKFLLQICPADTLTQAWAFYPRANGEQLLALLNRGWEIKPNFHFGLHNQRVVLVQVANGFRSVHTLLAKWRISFR
jgi:hypothetical protein